MPQIARNGDDLFGIFDAELRQGRYQRGAVAAQCCRDAAVLGSEQVAAETREAGGFVLGRVVILLR